MEARVGRRFRAEAGKVPVCELRGPPRDAGHEHPGNATPGHQAQADAWVEQQGSSCLARYRTASIILLHMKTLLPSPSPALAAVLVLAVAPLTHALTYTATFFSLGEYQPTSEYSSYNGSNARAVNAAGRIVGNAFGTYDMAGATFGSGTTKLNLGTLGTPQLGGHHTDALSVNDTHDVVGWSENTGTTLHAFYKASNGAIQDLGGFGGDNSMAYKINNKRQILVESDAGGTTRYHLYHAGKTLTFSLQIGFAPTDLNEKDQLVGRAKDGPRIYNVVTKAYTSLGRALGDAYPTAINNEGAVAGRKGDGLFYYASGKLSTHGTTIISVKDLNDAGYVVGSYEKDGSERAFLYSKAGGFVDLTQKLSGAQKAAGWELVTAEGINASGTIVGLARRPMTEDDPPYYGYEYVYRAYQLKALGLSR